VVEPVGDLACVVFVMTVNDDGSGIMSSRSSVNLFAGLPLGLAVHLVFGKQDVLALKLHPSEGDSLE
jgi:hypothetical protein